MAQSIMEEDDDYYNGEDSNGFGSNNGTSDVGGFFAKKSRLATASKSRPMPTSSTFADSENVTEDLAQFLQQSSYDQTDEVRQLFRVVCWHWIIFNFEAFDFTSSEFNAFVFLCLLPEPELGCVTSFGEFLTLVTRQKVKQTEFSVNPRRVMVVREY